ncbi:MAG: hypothetical protein IPN69_03790 [Acidobacteria bacterium]|nr:hypothetical protein [Acidobacteriota bacterium]
MQLRWIRFWIPDSRFQIPDSRFQIPRFDGELRWDLGILEFGIRHPGIRHPGIWNFGTAINGNDPPRN